VFLKEQKNEKVSQAPGKDVHQAMGTDAMGRNAGRTGQRGRRYGRRTWKHGFLSRSSRDQSEALEVESLGSGDPVGRLHTLTSETYAGMIRADWIEEVSYLIHQLFQELSREEFCQKMSRRVLCHQGVPSPELHKYRKMHRSLLADMNNVLFLLNRLGPAAEISQDWLIERIHHYLQIHRQLKSMRSQWAH
jgi:hypothetical protein